MKDYVIIETKSTFTQKYLVPLDVAENIEGAENLVKGEKVKEFSQSYIGEEIFKTDIVNENGVLALYEKDNPHLSEWSNEKKIQFADDWEWEEK